MSDTFMGSIAQKNVQFPIETVIEPMAGENYSRVMVFIPLSLAKTYLPGVSDASAGTLTDLTSSNYGSITGGLLNSWLVPFFTKAQTAKLGVAVYDDGDEATQTLAVVYEKFKMYAYFKLACADDTAYNDLQVALGKLCAADTLYSAFWVGTSDKNVLTATSALIQALNAVSSLRYHAVYNPDTQINPALAQLGASLSVANETGTPVGNSMDMVAFNTIEASGDDDADGTAGNLSATQCTALDNQKIAYNTWVGDGTENVVTEGSLYNTGDSCGAEWVKAYITYMCKVKTASMMSKINRFRNDATYQAILLILSDTVKGFISMGRLADFEITAPVFSDLPSSGDTITVANAWQATYIDDVREVTVYGTLYITQPTR